MSDEIVFKIGDVIIDKLTNEVGLLLSRYDVLDGFGQTTAIEDEEIGPIWAWDILWCGSKTSVTKLSRYGTHTELGLNDLVRNGAFELIKFYPKED